MKNTTLALLFLLFGVTLSAPAVDLFNTLPATNNTGSESPAGYRIGQSFSTTATSYNITSVDIDLSLTTTTSSGTYKISIYGYNTSNDNPTTEVSGSVIYNGAPTNLSTSVQTLNFNGLNIALSPSTKYYLMLTNNSVTGGTNGIYWEYTNDASTSASTGYSGTFYADDYYNSPNWSTGAAGNSPYIMRIQSSTVPEPTTWVLGLIAAGSLLGVARYRRKS